MKSGQVKPSKYITLIDLVGWFYLKGGRVGMWAPAHSDLGEIDVLLVPPDKACNLLTDRLITG